MSEPHLDPFSMVYNALWEMVERNKNLATYIPVGNRIKYDDVAAIRASNEDADTPELALLSGGGSFGDTDNSSQRSCVREYIWALTSGDLKLNTIFNPIQWELFRSMNDWECVLCSLTWCNCAFVSNCRIISAEDSSINHELERDILGWTSLWNMQVDFQFPKASLKLTM